MNEPCILCGIRDGKPAVRKLYEDDLVYAIDMPEDSPYYRAPVQSRARRDAGRVRSRQYPVVSGHSRP